MKKRWCSAGVLVFAACVAGSSSGKPDSLPGESSTGSDDTGTEDSGRDSGSIPEGTLEVSEVRATECDADTGDRFCNGERRMVRAVDLGGGTVEVADVGADIGCGGVHATARAVEQEIQVRYVIDPEADCNCQHLLEYEIYGVEPGLWTVVTPADDVEVEVAAAQ